MEEQNPIKKDAVNVPAVETFTNDMVKVIEDSQGGLIRKIIEEQEKHETEKKNFSPQSRRNKNFVLMSLVLILMAVALLAFIYIRKLDQVIPATNVPTVESNPIIFTEKTKLVPIDGLNSERIASALWQESNQANIKTGEIESIFTTENTKIVGLRRFTTLLKSAFVPGNSNLVSDQFLMGSVNRGTKGFFILLKVASFADVFEPMRSWEGTMFSELHLLTGQDLNPSTNYLLTKSFEDGFIENKNARILYDSSNTISLMYVFADENDVIISNSPNAIKEVMTRLASSQVKK